MIAIVRIAPSRMLSSTSASDSRMRCESSRVRRTVMSLGRRRCSSSIAPRTESATATVFAPESFCTSTETAGLPSSSAVARGSATPSITVATSPTVTATPLRTTTGIVANAFGSVTRPVMRTSCSMLPRLTRPAGISWFSRSSTAMTCGGEMP